MSGDRDLTEDGTMARMTAMDALERKIEKAQEQVSKTKKRYDAATARLSDLLDKRDALKRDELLKAIMKSDKTYDEVMEFLSSDTAEKGTNKSFSRKKFRPKQSRAKLYRSFHNIFSSMGSV